LPRLSCNRVAAFADAAIVTSLGGYVVGAVSFIRGMKREKDRFSLTVLKIQIRKLPERVNVGQFETLLHATLFIKTLEHPFTENFVFF